jgi:hypothetical protein
MHIESDETNWSCVAYRANCWILASSRPARPRLLRVTAVFNAARSLLAWFASQIWWWLDRCIALDQREIKPWCRGETNERTGQEAAIARAWASDSLPCCEEEPSRRRPGVARVPICSVLLRSDLDRWAIVYGRSIGYEGSALEFKKGRRAFRLQFKKQTRRAVRLY